MTHTQDEYFCWIKSSFGDIRLQHHNGIIDAVDDGRVYWAKGKTIETVLEWIKEKENVKLSLPTTKDQERSLLYEEEEKARVLWEREHWVCMEGGNGYFA